MLKTLKASRLSILALLCLLIVTGCATRYYMRDETAQRLAAPAFMLKRTVAAAPFELTLYERMHERYAPATIYIEGDGLNWVSPNRISLDPTPTNPVALHLSVMDNSKNVAYIARPCQYTKLIRDDKPCDPAFWTSKRYSSEVIESIGVAIDNIKRRYDITKVNLVGFSGGGAVAAILAATRDDVASLRTVAGNLDHKTHSTYHEVSPLRGSLNAIDYAPALKDIPQRHFIGGQDEIVPPAILHSYLQALGKTNCAQYTYVQEAEHGAGWVDKWPQLLKEPVECHGVAAAVPFDPIVPSALMKGSKK